MNVILDICILNFDKNTDLSDKISILFAYFIDLFLYFIK